jgi:hypothetical protein
MSASLPYDAAWRPMQQRPLDPRTSFHVHGVMTLACASVRESHLRRLRFNGESDGNTGPARDVQPTIPTLRLRVDHIFAVL